MLKKSDNIFWCCL